MIKYFLPFIFLFLSLYTIHCTLIIDEDFTTLNLWNPDIKGYTAIVELVPSSFNGTTSMLRTNISYCGGDECYRAEIACKEQNRTDMIANTTGVYWFGLSNYIPADWSWGGQTFGGYSEVIYNFQLHGGDNNGQAPVFGLRNIGNEMTLNVCGNKEFDSPTQVCSYYSLGIPAPGVWTDWVINVKLQWGTPTGYIKVWRNNELMVDVSNILTAFNDINPPYVKMGSYDIPWKSGVDTLTQWTGLYVSRFRIGDANSSYEEVYTGSGASCGVYCSTPNDDDNDDDEVNLLAVLLISTIPVASIALCMCLFYFAHIAVREKHQQDLILTGYAHEYGDADMLTNMRPSAASAAGAASFSGGRHNGSRENSIDGRGSWYQSFRHSLSRSSLVNVSRKSLTAMRDTFVWAEEEDFVHSSRFVWTDPWQASPTRKAFWYIFGYGLVTSMFFFSMLLYGNPVSGEDGLLRWKTIDDWEPYDVVALMCATFTYIGIFFLPLALMPHNLEEGRSYRNNPDFLRRIGVVIPCHKSAQEIGGVLKQVLKYIPPENIVVCDNGNFNWPADNTYEVVKEAHKNIQYCFISQGHKTRALWTGCHRLPRQCEYIIHLDDDTLLSDHMVFDERHFKTDDGEHVAAVAFLRCSHRINRVTNFTDFWYKITDHFHATQGKIATRAFVPGPAGIWRRDRFIEVFGAHPALPFGEDIFGGFTLLNKGYAIRAETRCMVTTFAPPILVNCGTGGRVQGYGASSLWKQRAHRWTVSALRITGQLRDSPSESILQFFLIMCAVHGRLKCLLWYLPNVPPNHGMLQRCRPRPLAVVRDHSKKAVKQNPEVSNSRQSSIDGSQCSVNLTAIVSDPKENMDGSPADPKADDAFEFFYRDGSSVFASYYSYDRPEDYQFTPGSKPDPSDADIEKGDCRSTAVTKDNSSIGSSSVLEHNAPEYRSPNDDMTNSNSDSAAVNPMFTNEHDA